ncbi:DNA starvation/stationary phase protection protein [Erysipelothrix larvae]|uniref:DNA starvation/stationary phase protection protein n=1 Tax=Erysipelothrix larvae TaxID=1514105 RepID=A0A0X8GZ56_9FIRM|nr:DNA starvation/stationary phase protection protein [Erysipelothrix larvae]AMC92924.1 DNA starvation/stationary phase protection protein [Erysipelothrix larvae]
MNNLYEALNTFLADQTVLSMKIHNVHWYMVGEGFFPMHKEMDKLYDQAQENIDLVAERLLVLGAKPLGSLKEMLARTSVEELSDTHVNVVEGVQSLIADFDRLYNLALHIVKEAENVEDPGTADHFTAISQDLGKTLWMLKAYTHNAK